MTATESSASAASLWAARGRRDPRYRPADPPAGDRAVDVVVVGGGVAGLTIALRLREQGAEVAVLERHGVGGGVTGGSTAKVTALHGLVHSAVLELHGPEASGRYARANAAAVDRVAEAADRHGIACGLTRADAVNYATTGTGLACLERDLGALRDAGLPAERRDGTGLPFPVTGAVVLPDQLHLHPRRYCEGLAAALGPGAVHEHTAVVAVDEDDAGCHARTSAGATIHAPHAVVATLGPIVDPRYLTVRCRPSRSYAVAVEVDGPVPPEMYLSIDDGAPTRSLRPATVDGTAYLVVGGEGHPVGDERDARTHLAALESWARAHFPVRSVAHRWAAHDQVPSDHLPFAGRLVPGSRRWVTTGFQKWGFTMSMVAADLIAAGIAGVTGSAGDAGDASGGHGGDSDALAGLLDPSRLRSTVTGELARDVGRVACRFVGDEVAARLLRRGQDAESVPAGTGRVVPTRAGPTAVHRDAEGRLHAVSARCTHEGCLVRFNRAQQTWDCPCHGSRFAPDGTVLSGPAVRDLAPVELPDPERVSRS